MHRAAARSKSSTAPDAAQADEAELAALLTEEGILAETVLPDGWENWTDADQHIYARARLRMAHAFAALPVEAERALVVLAERLQKRGVLADERPVQELLTPADVRACRRAMRAVPQDLWQAFCDAVAAEDRTVATIMARYNGGIDPGADE